ncbi:MAG: hypothetical protein HY682_05795 [Chloroflexi bacterium]|nr:hypothetical protein [Chloroflexota bacterium]
MRFLPLNGRGVGSGVAVGVNVGVGVGEGSGVGVGVSNEPTKAVTGVMASLWVGTVVSAAATVDCRSGVGVADRSPGLQAARMRIARRTRTAQATAR